MASAIWSRRIVEPPENLKLDATWVTRQTTRRIVGTSQDIMRELLQQIDLDYYRMARLLMVRAELEHLRRERPADVERQRGHELIVDRETEASLLPA